VVVDKMAVEVEVAEACCLGYLQFPEERFILLLLVVVEV
jgi:hypothetical protein